MAGKFTRAAHLRWRKKYEILNYIESHNFGLNYVLIKSNRTALQTYKVEERTFGTPCRDSPFKNNAGVDSKSDVNVCAIQGNIV